jgi:hypothetical protein
MLDKNLVHELRRMFIDGATPSQLMHHIEKQCQDDRRLHFVIKDYFREAFRIPLLRNVVSGEGYSPNSRHAHYNREVVPEMIQRIGEWNRTDLEGSWLEGVSVHSLSEHTERLQTARFEELDRVWDSLSDNEKLFIIRKIALKDYYWDVVKGLASLAERLQERIVALEERLKEEHPTPTCSEGEFAPTQHCPEKRTD